VYCYVVRWQSYGGVYGEICGGVLTEYIYDGQGVCSNSIHPSTRGRQGMCPNSVRLLKMKLLVFVYKYWRLVSVLRPHHETGIINKI